MKNARVLRSGFRKRTRRIAPKVLLLWLCGLILVPAGCESGDGKSSTKTALLGAGIGGLAGQAIGRNTTGTLIGAGVGAGVGYIIGNEKDKKAAQSYNYSEKTPLTGTAWKVVSLDMPEKPPYETMTVAFEPDGNVVTTKYEPDGGKTVSSEKYRVVGDTLIINKPGYLINAKYRVTGNEMIVDCEQFHAVLQRI